MLLRSSKPVAYDELLHFDSGLPNADWLWGSLQHHCVPQCCGLAAYDFSHESVRWACADDIQAPEGFVSGASRLSD